MAVFKLFKALALAAGVFSVPALSYTPCAGCPYDPPVGSTTTTPTPTACNPSCVPPIATVTSITSIQPTQACPTTPIPTSTCTDNIYTSVRSLTLVVDCLPPVLVPYTRCPQTTTFWQTVMPPIACLPQRATRTVVECPYATATTVTTTVVTQGGPCIPRKTSTLPPSGTDLLPTCPPTPTPTGNNIPKWGQCAGYGFDDGGRTCIAGTTCTMLNVYYSQCL